MSYKATFTHTYVEKHDFCEACATFEDSHLNAALAATFGTVTRSHSPATAIRQNCTFGTSRSAAPATRLHNTVAQSVAIATRKRSESNDTLLKYCATQAQPSSLRVRSSKTSISCETSSTFARQSTSCTSS